MFLVKQRHELRKKAVGEIDLKGKTYDELLSVGEIKPVGKILEISLAYNQDNTPNLSLISISKKNGYPPKYPQENNGYKLQILNNENVVLYDLLFAIPNEILPAPPLDGEQPALPVKLSQVDFALTIPWFENSSRLNILNPDGKNIISSSLLDIPSIENKPDFQSIKGDELLQIIPFSSSDNQYLDVVYIGDDYTQDELDTFHDDVRRSMDHMITIEPFKSRASQLRFNYVDNTNDLGCTFAYPWRCNLDRVVQELNNAGVPYDTVIIIVNTDEGIARAFAYLGLNFAVSRRAEWAPKSIVHEIGHSFGGLWDEYVVDPPYDYPVHTNCYEGLPPTPEWQNLVAPGDYAQGCTHRNWYRSSPRSIMLNSNVPYFNAVSQIFLNNNLDFFAGSFSDNILPTSSIISPANGATVSGIINITTDLRDNNGIARAELYKDDSFFTTVYQPPFTFPSINLGVYGQHTLLVKAYDVVNNVGLSQSITVTVDNYAPWGTLSVSPNPALAGQTVTISVTGNDDKDIYVLQAYYQGAWNNKVCEGTQTTCTKTWTTSYTTEGTNRICGNIYDNASPPVGGRTSPDCINLVVSAPTPTPSPTPTIPQDDLFVTQDTALAPGNYQINDVNRDGVIIIKADNVTLNCNGATINGSNYTGFGIYNNGFHNLTIKNCNIGKYYYALRSENGNSLIIQNNNLSGNRLIPDGNFFVNINQGPEITDSAYLGGGIYLRNSSGSNISGNTLINQQNGIDLYSVTNTTVTGNNTSDDAGWGIHLYASTSNTISGNTADRVTRNCYGRPGCDSAGFLLVWNSHSNQITNNSFQHGAEGFFIGNEGGFPSNNNTISNNNGSYSTHNAFETTFSENNTFSGNIASNSNYGFWLGYSSNSRIEGNTIENNRTDGIAIEHGHNNILINNTIKNNKQVGINLWTDYDDFLLRKYPANRYSYGYTITNNALTANGKNIVFMGTTNSLIKDNALSDSSINLYLRQANINGELVNSQENTIESNDFFCTPPQEIYNCQYHFYNYQPADVAAKYNWWGTTDTTQINTRIYDKNDNSTLGVVSYEPFLTDSFKKQSKLVAKIKFQGVSVQRSDKQVRVTLKGGQVFENVLVSSDNQGVYAGNIDNITPGTYEVLIKGPSHLQKNFGGVTFTDGQIVVKDWSGTPFKTGDAVNNNSVDIYDYNKVVEHFGPRMPSQGSLADFDLDGDVDIFDYNYLVGNFNQRGEE